MPKDDEATMVPVWRQYHTMKKPKMPYCSAHEDVRACPSYDGKRCTLHGWRPGELCHPAIASIFQAFEEEPVKTAAVLAMSEG